MAQELWQFPGDDLEDLEDELDQVNWELKKAVVLSPTWFSLRGKRSDLKRTYDRAYLEDLRKRSQDRRARVKCGIQL